MEEILKEVGMSEAEAQVYLDLLESGPSKASDISKRTGMYRPFVYDNLNKLMERGFCSSALIDGKKHFKAAEPQALRDYMKEKLQLIEDALPELEKRNRFSEEDAYVEVYKGKNAIRKAFLDILRILKEKRCEHLGIGIDEEMFLRTEPTFSRWFIKQLEKYNIHERMISYESENVFAGGKTTEYRFIPDELFSPSQTLIDGDLVTHALFESRPKFAIKIKSAELAEAYRKQFELMWKGGKKKEWKQTTALP